MFCVCVVYCCCFWHHAWPALSPDCGSGTDPRRQGRSNTNLSTLLRLHAYCFLLSAQYLIWSLHSSVCSSCGLVWVEDCFTATGAWGARSLKFVRAVVGRSRFLLWRVDLQFWATAWDDRRAFLSPVIIYSSSQLFHSLPLLRLTAL